ncbi:MAG: DUF2892 domain-containing protein [Candidatus Margulisbacteria bacterium]|nr:DUF2892 domain-containing protein [Candidatus Margulisiibacteriota bacterium]
MGIERNESTTDRFIRIIIGGILVLATSYISMSTVLLFILLIVGLFLMLTGLAGFCPLYKLLGIRTGK